LRELLEGLRLGGLVLGDLPDLLREVGDHLLDRRLLLLFCH
jgi:hypothetical protein